VRARGPGLLLGLVLGLLALGPGIRRGFLLSYDMVFVPREPFSAALPGLAPPRAVPSDLVIATASRLLPADIVQKALLLAIFMLACAGVGALLDGEPLLARLAGGAFYAWNPYVAERLIIGQWALLLGYAGLPWVLRAVLQPDLAAKRGVVRLAAALLPAIIGGFTAMAITGLVLIPVVLLTRDPRKALVALAAFAAGCLPWLIPSLLHSVYAAPAGAAAFAARADTPFGSLGSLLMLGGMWNADTVPKGYGGPWSALWLGVVLAALAGYALGRRRAEPPDGASSGPADRPADRPSRWPGLGIAAVAGLLIACIGVTAPGRELLRSVTAAFSGAAILRDGQQFVAPLALAEACGLGRIVGRYGLNRPFGSKDLDLAGAVLSVVSVLAPLLLLPGLAWGAAGRLRPAWYPASWLAAAREIDGSRAAGAVLLLPWASYRAPAFNHGEVMLDPWPRLLSRPVIWNDGAQVGNIVMAPDYPAGQRLAAVISGGGPLTETLVAAGVRFVLADAGPAPGARLPGARMVVREPGLVVYELPGRLNSTELI
jgi:hypothetical protein